jgi:hypothetical protein
MWIIRVFNTRYDSRVAFCYFKSQCGDPVCVLERLESVPLLARLTLSLDAHSL